MAVSQTSLCNQALTRLGAQRITDIAESSVEAEHCRLFFETSVRELLRSHPWGFARRRSSLSQSPTAPAFGFTYAFLLPADYLYILDVNGWDVSAQPSKFEIEGNEVFCDDSTAKARYIVYVGDVAQYPPDFNEALIVLLASKLAVPIAGNAAMAGAFREEYEVLQRPRAARQSSNESRTKRTDQLITDSDLVAARFTG